ncbi:DUF4173 domain-containing protein [Phenylobacterium sp. Root700]|uniref:DUF4153 domain-containing protein n=1 Tax=Phenylobacterium sp. Root700 TaxID=1736591 RepID=UPI00070020D9|nr:DUF4173 domain-containing protein [Phenylobacterium sp. Root700]KRB42037.1 hypothetical protein ASE02_04290 [Phenylobacterium sp. Root700]
MQFKLGRWRLALWTKVGLAAALVALADLLLYDHTPGASLGLFTTALALGAALVHPALRRDRRGAWALAIAGGFALLMIEDPGLLAWLLFWTALAVAVLSARAGTHDDVWRWFQRLVFAGLAGVPAPFLDAKRVLGRGAAPGRLRRTISLIALPLIGGALFLSLFVAANPVLEAGFAAFRLPELSIARGLFWLLVTIAVWAAMRPRALRRPLPLAIRPGLTTSATSLVLSLVVFNGLFALQNGLDMAFLWSGAALPDGVSFAQYAHRGAYMLIFTALLAGAFVLAFLHPGTPSAERPLIRWLVIAWVAQNILLVASSVLRTLDYVEAYGLTGLRISALTWMALVAVGLVLICVRLLAGKSPSWLINANALALGLTLTLASIVDVGAISAAWNVRHAREVGGGGAELDLCYLAGLNDAALVPLVDLEQRPLPADMRRQVAWIRSENMTELADRQSQWRSWTWRGQRRLDTAASRLGQLPTPLPPPDQRSCDWRSKPQPLTAPPQDGT